MRYWDEMQNKYGFGDGDQEVPGIDQYRDLYCTAVNALAKQAGSRFRYMPYDRFGMDNGCLVLLVPADAYENPGGEPLVPDPLLRPDIQMDAALWRARELDLDAHVMVTVAVDHVAVADLLANLPDWDATPAE